MKKVILSALTFGLIFTACTNNGAEAATGDAVAIEDNATAESITLSTVADGSNIEWFASHLGGTGARFGKIKLQSADVTVNDGKVENATVVVEMNSLTVENFEGDVEQTEKLTGHLKSADFFNVEKNPTAKFELASIEAGTGEYNSVVTGNLTILDSTKSVTFNANVMADNDGVTISSEKFAIDRTLWGMNYHVEGSEGVPVDYLIANEVGFIINVKVEK